MSGEFNKPSKVNPAIVGQIADPDVYNQNIGAQSTDKILAIDIDGNYKDNFDVGDNAVGTIGSLVQNIKMRLGGALKIYDAFGVFLRDVSFDSISGKNGLYNASFEVCNEATSFAAIANGTYFSEGWIYRKSGAMVHTVSRDSDVPAVGSAGRKIPYSIKVNCTTVDASIAAGDYCYIEQIIEGFDWCEFAQRDNVYSFWVKGTKTGIHCATLRNNAPGTPDRSFVGEFTINASNTWEYKTVQFTASPSAGTWQYDNTGGVYLGIVLAAGSTFQTTKDTWQTGNYLATSNQVNVCDNTANDFFFCAPQFEKGTIATAFDKKEIGETIRKCERYWEKSYDFGVAPAAITDVGQVYWYIVSGQSAPTTVFFKAKKRNTPTITLYSPVTGATAVIRQTGSSTDRAASVTAVGQNSFAPYFTANANSTGNGAVHYTANSRF